MKERILLSFAGVSGAAMGITAHRLMELDKPMTNFMGMGLTLLALLVATFAIIEYRQAKHGLPY